MTDWEVLASEADEPDDGSYVHSDEFDDVRASLLLLRDAVKAIPEQPSYWKWAILAAHSAVQSACVCLLTRTDGGGALTKKSEKELKEYHDLASQRAITEAAGGTWILGKAVHPNEQVETFPGLLRRLPSGMKIDFPGGENTAKDQLTKDFVKIHDFRNNFTHFRSVGWSIEVAGLPRILGAAVDLVEKIAFSGDYQRFNRFGEMDLEGIFSEIREGLKAL